MRKNRRHQIIASHLKTIRLLAGLIKDIPQNIKRSSHHFLLFLNSKITYKVR